jgi:hypothetical protein
MSKTAADKVQEARLKGIEYSLIFNIELNKTGCFTFD